MVVKDDLEGCGFGSWEAGVSLTKSRGAFPGAGGGREGRGPDVAMLDGGVCGTPRCWHPVGRDVPHSCPSPTVVAAGPGVLRHVPKSLGGATLVCKMDPGQNSVTSRLRDLCLPLVDPSPGPLSLC